MEEELTLDELYLLLEASRDKEHRKNKFLAALKGIDLDEGSNDAFERVKKKAQAAISGQREEESAFKFIGIEFDEDD